MAEAGAPPPPLGRPDTLLEGMYTAAAGMAAQQTRLDAVANDLANVSTTGYKHRPRRLPRPALRAQAAGAVDGRSPSAPAPRPPTIGRGAAQGALQNTGQPARRRARRATGFIAVRGRDGQPAMTRDGALRLDDRNRLVTDDGLLLDPPVTSRPATDPKNIEIAADGTVARRRPARSARCASSRCRRPSQLAGRPGQHLQGDRAPAAPSSPRPAGTTRRARAPWRPPTSTWARR